MNAAHEYTCIVSVDTHVIVVMDTLEQTVRQVRGQNISITLKLNNVVKCSVLGRREVLLEERYCRKLILEFVFY